MTKIEIEPMHAARMVFGYGLVIFGIVLLINTYIQASITINTLMAVMSEIMPNPTLVIYTGKATELPGFAETLSWFFMLLIQTLIGFFVATLGVRIARK